MGRIGYFNASYDDLCRVLGSPNSCGCDGKVNIEWIINVNNKYKFSIYDFKEDTDVRDLSSYYWHIGARDERLYKYIVKYLNNLLHPNT
jgi:hypothetical protein